MLLSEEYQESKEEMEVRKGSNTSPSFGSESYYYFWPKTRLSSSCLISKKWRWRWRDSSEYLLIIIISIIRIWIWMFLGGSRGQTNPYHIPYHNQVLLCVIKWIGKYWLSSTPCWVSFVKGHMFPSVSVMTGSTHVLWFPSPLLLPPSHSHAQISRRLKEKMNPSQLHLHKL